MSEYVYVSTMEDLLWTMKSLAALKPLKKNADAIEYRKRDRYRQAIILRGQVFEYAYLALLTIEYGDTTLLDEEEFNRRQYLKSQVP